MKKLEDKIGWKFDNTYLKLPEILLSKINPTPVKHPKLVIFNHNLSKNLNLDFSSINEDDIALLFSGNKLPKGSETIAQAYAGHQFGHFAILGDGRALIVGEHLDKLNNRYDLQLKGSGKTPYSRNADGRAAVGPMVREYLISEAMNLLNISTTRSLAVVKTGEKVIREEILDGAILTRVASSHIRVGTFQFASLSRKKNDLKLLLEYTINRHYPNLKNRQNPALELLKSVQEKQINLICNWMRVGFVHGVMNTDNMSIAGETIDYGPCAFMNAFNPNTVFSSIDRQGRYAYFNQPNIARWNLERFAESLLSLVDEDTSKAVEFVKEVLVKYEEIYKMRWIEMMKNKLGIQGIQNEDEKLILELLTWMHNNKADYTNTFCFLMNELNYGSEIYKKSEFQLWKKKWEIRRKFKNTEEKSQKIMKDSNPLVIPRNHLVEEALKDVIENNNSNKIHQLLNVIENPREHFSLLEKYQSVPNLDNERYVTFCGT